MNTGRDLPLTGLRVVTMAPNLPGPVAAHRLAERGADVVKVEPPAGDMMATAAPAYYAALCEGQEVITLDLKGRDGRDRMDELLDGADLLITSSRPAALAKLHLGWDALHDRHPLLCQVAIVGTAGAADVPGHDLTYQAAAGILDPGAGANPRVLIADLAGAERVVGEALAALWATARDGRGRYREVGLSDVAEDFAEPARRGFTTPDGLLGGGLPQYRVYDAAEGRVAVAALEPHFWAAMIRELGITPDGAGLEDIMRTRTAAEWEQWALDHQLPLAEVREPRPL